MKVLVIGASGMIGSTVLRVLADRKDWQVHGTVREASLKRLFPAALAPSLIHGVDVMNLDAIVEVLGRVRADVVINCAGLTKHKEESSNALACIAINALMPHRLAAACSLAGARLIHISTDCVFLGDRGEYSESDFTDATDLYGWSMALGEVIDANSITLRTSTIGHELNSKYGLLEWFLSQQTRCNGFSKAIFSGLPTVTFAEIIRDVVIPRPQLSGLYNVAAAAINKFELLTLIRDVYCKEIEIVEQIEFSIDRSLDGTHFSEATGYVAPPWSELIRAMHAYS